MVTGGTTRDYDGIDIDTTEVYDSNLGSWVISGAKLPRPMSRLRATNIDGRVLIFGNFILFTIFTITRSHRNIILIAGGYDGDIYDEILEFRSDEDAIVTLGHMTQARHRHAISVVQMQDYSNWCQ